MKARSRSGIPTTYMHIWDKFKGVLMFNGLIPDQFEDNVNLTGNLQGMRVLLRILQVQFITKLLEGMSEHMRGGRKYSYSINHSLVVA